ncbi:SIS domain-containing protein [Nocardia beijingensis]|uniref:SIS domain-containing protein n=1 Tax=Nocardia beijingensis TaxID=95162 RepID=A0ABW7W7A8_9NOCA
MLTVNNSRLDRYEEFLRNGYLAGLTRGDEYDSSALSQTLVDRCRAGVFTRIVFTGMGCSAIVSEVIRGYFVAAGIPIDVVIVNGYEFDHILPPSVLTDPTTLIVISSYSGYSQEPLIAFERLLRFRDRVVLLTSGGALAEAGKRAGSSILYWRLENPDREYPLFHVTQYFAILLDAFSRLSMINGTHAAGLEQLARDLAEHPLVPHAERARVVADQLFESNIVMIAPPLWHDSLLKLCKMHLNEIAMVPATRNYLHEFCHSEVATLSDPERTHSVIVLRDPDSDGYTQSKTENLVSILRRHDSSCDRADINVVTIDLEGRTYLHKFFGALRFVQELTLALGRLRVVDSRDLISRTAGNPWYHSSTIDAERRQIAG